MAQGTRTTVVGVFDENERAKDAIQALKDAGFAAEDIGVLMRDRGEARDLAQETGSRAGEGAATGAIGGGILGGLAGWLVGIGALAIPGVGPFIAAGAFGTALAGAGIGAGVGAIAGALAGMGVPKEEAEFYEGEVRGGNTLVTVNTVDRYDEARGILQSHGAYDVESRHAGAGEAGTTGTAGSYGGGREEGYVERRPQDRPSERPVGMGEDESTRMGARGEREIPEKETVVREEGDFEIIGGEGYGTHEHRWVGDRCEICGATRRYRRAA